MDPLSLRLQELWKNGDRQYDGRQRPPHSGQDEAAIKARLHQGLKEASPPTGAAAAANRRFVDGLAKATVADASKARLRRHSPGVAQAGAQRLIGPGHGQRAHQAVADGGKDKSRPYVNRICICVHADLMI